MQIEEYGTLVGVELTPNDIAVLTRSVRSLRIQPSLAVPGTFDLTAAHEVGVIHLSDRVLTIRPKVEIDRVLFLVSYALDKVRWNERATAFGDATDLVEAMAGMFAFELTHALRSGLLHGYRVEEDWLQTIRGRVRFEDQLRTRYRTTPPVAVRYDDYTADTDLNRLLFAAARVLLRLPLRSEQIRGSLLACTSAFRETVTAVDFTSSTLPFLSWNRLTDRFRVVAELASFIIRSASLESVRGGATGSGFVVNMNVVFESFVRAALADALALKPHEFPVGSAVKHSLDEDDQIGLEPDLSWKVDGTYRFVGDAKYKRLPKSEASRQGHLSDLHQLLAYVVGFDVSAGLLVYGDGAASQSHTVRHLGKRLDVMSLDLSGTPEEILAGVEVVAERVREIATSSTFTTDLAV